MRLYVKQRVFSLTDSFCVYGANEEAVFTVKGEFLSFGKRLHIYDQCGQECALVSQRVFSFLPRYQILRQGALAAEVSKEWTFFRQEYAVSGPGWVVNGDFFAHEYAISRGEKTVARISKAWLSWGDTYEIHIAEDTDPVLALAVVLVIDACNASDQTTTC